LPPPLDQQSGLVCPVFLQFSHLLVDADDVDTLGLGGLPDALLLRAISTDSDWAVLSSSMTLCLASTMKNAVKSFSDNIDLFAFVTAVSVCSVGQYDAGKEDIMIILNCMSENVDPICIRFSQRIFINLKCHFILARWAFGSVDSLHFIAASCSSASMINMVLFEVASVFT
jgi:hypothetical protein